MLFAPSTTLLSALFALPSFIAAISIDCTHIRVDGVSFDISALAGPHSVLELQRTPTAIKNTTFTIDMCAPLLRDAEQEKADQCPSGSRVCAQERFYHKVGEEEPLPEDVWPVAGEFIHDGASRQLDPTYTRLKSSDSHADAEREGLRIGMNGGVHEGVRQMAVVELVCNREKTGLEGEPQPPPAKETQEAKPDGERRLATRSGEVRRDDEGDAPKPLPDTNLGRSLQFRSYRIEPSGADEIGVLRLEWETKYACEDQKKKDDTDRKDSSSGWGFFTWFIIIVFLGVAAYLIFGSWLNWSRYGARGWDLLPHGDTIRDVPYLLKDWARRIMSTIQGGGGRGYSAI